MSQLKDNFLEFIGMIFGFIVFASYFILPGLTVYGIYHTAEYHKKELVLSVVIPPWGFYRGVESFWHKNEEIHSGSTTNEDVVPKKIQNYDWKNYTAPDGTFSVDLPGNPKIETVSQNGGENTQYTVIGKDMRAMYSIEYTKFSDKSVGSIPLKDIISSYRDENKSIVIEQEEFKNQTWIAKGKLSDTIKDAEETKIIKWFKDAKFEMKLTVIGNAIYTQKVIYDPSIDTKEITNFFDSFSIKLQ